jgi:hypothetical protein
VDQVDLVGPKDLRELAAHRDLLDCKEIKDLKVFEDHKDHKDQVDQVGHKVLQVYHQMSKVQLH